MKKEKSAGAVIYYWDEKQKQPIFLFLQNTLKTTYWEFPKGKIEKDEKIESTVKREIKEETNLDKLQIIPDFKHELQWYFRLNGETIRKKAVYFLAKIKSEDKDNVKISKEHQKFSWMNFEHANKEIKIKSNKEMLKTAYNFILNYERQKSLF